MTEVDCPVDGCDYSGETNSVEAHISSSTDDGHSGKAGSEFRSELQGEESAEQEPEQKGDEAESVTADDLAEMAEEDDDGDLGAYALIAGAALVLYLIGAGSNSGGPANV